MNKPTALFYNALALLSVGIGLLNSILTIRLLGITAEADIWLLSVAMVTALCVLSQLGVEQFLYFYEEQRALNQTQAVRFTRAAVTWAILTGVAFALLAIVALPLLKLIFAFGLPVLSQDRVAHLIIAMAPQMAAAPLLHVIRQYQNAVGRYTLSYLLMLWSPMVLLLILLCASLLNTSPEKFAWVVGAGALIQSAACLLIMWPTIRYEKQMAWSAPYFRRFIFTSIAMRSGHALHNFFSNAIINSTLSTFAVGNVALFQYAFRFAAGANAIAVGPHGSIFQARAAKAWAAFAPSEFFSSARQYLTHIFPIYFCVVLVTWLVLRTALELIIRIDVPIEKLTTVFLFLCVWYAVLQLEGVFITVIIIAHDAVTLIVVNSLFAILFFSFSHANLALNDYLVLPIAATFAQLVSLGLYFTTARRKFRLHFKTMLSVR